MFGFFKGKHKDREGVQRMIESDALAEALTMRRLARERLDKALGTPNSDSLARITWELASKSIPPPDHGAFPDPAWSGEAYWKSAEAVLRKARETVEATLR